MDVPKVTLDNIGTETQCTLRVESCAECELVYIERRCMINLQELAHQRGESCTKGALEEIKNELKSKFSQKTEDSKDTF